MHDVHINGRHHPVAATWNELPRPVLLQAVAVLYAGAPSDAELRLRLLQALLQVPRAVIAGFTSVQVVQIFWLTDFLLTDVDLTDQLLPEVRRGKKTFHGPRARFRNLRFLEFIFADAYFVAFSQEPDHEEWLNRLVAVLYRPERRPYQPLAVDYGGDRREDFNEHHVALRTARLARIPRAEKLAIYTWYRGCRLALERDFPHVFTPAHQDAAQQATDGWAHVLREMSGPTFGPMALTEQQLVRTVLAKMEDDAVRAEQLRRQAETQSSPQS